MTFYRRGTGLVDPLDRYTIPPYGIYMDTFEHDHDEHSGHGEHGHDKHSGHDVGMFRRRFWWSLLVTVPLVVTSEMIMDWFGYRLDFTGIALVGPVLGTFVFVWGGWPFLEGGAREAADRQPGMMLLIAMAISVAYVASLATSIGWFDLDFWWELGTLISIMLLGHWQEMRALGQAQDALSALAALLPDEAERIGPGGDLETVAVSALEVGDTVLVRSGARVPADGTIVDGEAELDESMITGESRPVPKIAGDRVVAGTVSTDSAIRVEVVAVGDDTTLAGIGRLVAQAQASRSRSQVLADRAAALLFYVAVGAAVVTGLAWTLVGRSDEAVVRVVTVLIISCPHALGLAIPLTTALSSGMAARSGILIKDRLALEAIRTVDTVLFDKTGTLTKGEHAVIDVAASGGLSDAVLLGRAGAVEADSEHPLARAIVAAARDQGEVVRASEFRSLTGRGVEATVDGTRLAVGGPALLRERDLAIPEDIAEQVASWRERGAAVLFLMDAERVLGAIALEDQIRPEARDAVDQLRRSGRRVVMITGDARQVADAVAVGPRTRRGVRRGPARGQGIEGGRAAGQGRDGRDGGRRRQRRTRPGPGRRRPRHRGGNRRRHRVGRAHPGQLGSAWGRRRLPSLGRHLPQVAAEPGVGGRVQHRGDPGGGRCAVLGGHHHAAGAGSGADERVHHRGCAQRPAPATRRPSFRRRGGGARSAALVRTAAPAPRGGTPLTRRSSVPAMTTSFAMAGR
jgi:P-type Cu2+ transporter